MTRREFVAGLSLASLVPAAAQAAAGTQPEGPASERLFTDEQLDLLATPLSIHLERAVRSRDTSRLGWITAQMDMERLAIYDSYLQWVAVLQTFIVQESGEERHDDALRQMGEHSFREFVLAYRGLTLRDHVDAVARRLRAAGSTFRVEDLPDRVRFRLDPWGGVVRQWRAPAAWQATAPRQRVGDEYVYQNFGAYSAPTRLAVLGRGRPLTQGRDNLPCFFATEILFLEILAIELLGYPIAVITLPRDAEDVAYLDVYKDLSNIPAEAYSRVGTAKPASGLPAWPASAPFTAEELAVMGMPPSIRVARAAEKGDWAQLQAIVETMDDELVRAKDSLGILINGLLTWIARNLGETQAERALVRTAEVVMAPYVDAVRGLRIKEAIEMWAMVWRSHGSTFNIEEHDDVFIFRGRPLGACGRMWATRYQPRIERISESRIRYPTFGSYNEPMCCHLMREPRGITYGKTAYPIYSTHCHMLHEIYAIDQIGYPLWVELHPLHDRDGETVHIHYKDPAKWPAEAYRRVGRSKPAVLPSRT
ncbi:MAG: hypothetical protein MUC71_04310 [Steroidobacteraceae bacterium]|nr:hypothetical protein [Steroidobacteraceae bacterium]